MPDSPPATIPEVTVGAVRAQLASILASNTFRTAPRAARFLRFVVENHLAGQRELLKEYLVGVEVFDRDASFDPRADSVVRVEARRLREKLRDYYETEGRGDRLLIGLPKGGYAPAFRFREHSQPAAPPRRWSAVWIPWAILASLLSAGGGVWLYTLGSRPPITTVAILPFENLTPDPANDLFCQGLVDELTTELAKVKELRIVGRISAFRFKKGALLADVGRLLRAGAVVEGSVRREGGRVRVTAQLIRVEDNSHIWAESYERELNDVFALDGEIARSVTAALKLRLLAGHPAHTGHPPDPEAVAAYWRGRYIRRQPQPDALQKALEQFQAAAARDPDFAPAQAELAETYSTLAFHSLVPASDSIIKARRAARRAIELDRTLPDPHVTLGWIAFFYDRNWTAAESDLRRALELNPSHARAHNAYALGLAAHGRFREAAAESGRARDLDPLSFAASNDLALILYCSRKYDESIRAARAALELNPSFAPAHAMIGTCEAARRNFNAAIRELKTALERSPERYSYILGRLAYAHARGGRPDLARQLLAEITRRPDDIYYVHVALAHTGLGETELALDALASALERREADVNFIAVDPLFDPLRPHAGFAALVRNAGL